MFFNKLNNNFFFLKAIPFIFKKNFHKMSICNEYVSWTQIDYREFVNTTFYIRTFFIITLKLKPYPKCLSSSLF